MGRLALLLSFLLVDACSKGRTNRRDPVVHRYAVTGPVVATVGGEPITASEIRAVARAENITEPRAALERAITLRLLAREATRRGLDRDPLVADTERRAMEQALLAATVERDVRPETLSASTMASAMREFGWPLAHGELYRTQHLVLRTPRQADASIRARLRAQAEAFRERALALPAPRGGEPFARLAATALADLPECPPRPDITRACWRVEELPPIDREGHHAHGDVVREYAAAAASLSAPGDVSALTETPFGYHVIVLLDRLPALQRPAAEVQARVEYEALWRLRARAFDRLLATLRERHHTQVREEALRALDGAHLPLVEAAQ